MLVRAIYFVDIRAGDAIATLLRANSAQFTYATIIGVIVLIFAFWTITIAVIQVCGWK